MTFAVVLLCEDGASTQGVSGYISGKWEMMWHYK